MIYRVYFLEGMRGFFSDPRCDLESHGVAWSGVVEKMVSQFPDRFAELKPGEMFFILNIGFDKDKIDPATGGAMFMYLGDGEVQTLFNSE